MGYGEPAAVPERPKMNKIWLIVPAACCSAGAALAQDSGISVSVGARAWYTDWSTFSYLDDGAGNNIALTQVSAQSKLTFIPVVSVRYGDFFGSVSALPSTRFTFDDGGSGKRQEFDVNLGYSVLPGLALTLGYKKVSQSDGPNRYRPAGPVIGVSGNAPLGGAWSLYGSLGVGKLETPSGDPIDFEADYRLTELGVAYTLSGPELAGRWTFTGGYRIQVMTSKDAFGSQDGRDTTQGFTLGAIATF